MKFRSVVQRETDPYGRAEPSQPEASLATGAATRSAMRRHARVGAEGCGRGRACSQTFGLSAIRRRESALEPSRSVSSTVDYARPDFASRNAGRGVVSLGVWHFGRVVPATRSAHARVRAAIAEYARPAHAPAREPGSPERARELIDRLGLRSCGACQTSDLLLVRSDLALHGPEGSWPVAVVACAACGDVRLRMRDPEALQRARRDPAWEPVALPGVGPFRSG